MTLNRIWIPSPNYSSRGGTGVRLVVVHTAEGSTSIESLGNFFASSSSGVSSHTGIDDKANTCGEFVSRPNKAWTQGNANPYSVSTELCAFAAWGRPEWEAHPAMLDNCREWIAEECAYFGIPLVKLSSGEAQGGAAGVCGHVDLGSAGGGHWDPGPDFPWDIVLTGAPGPPSPAPTPPPGPPSTGPAPPWPGRYFEYPPLMSGADVAQWQEQMHFRGWQLETDGMYGPESAGICLTFQTEKGLTADGIVGPDTWAAAWAAPVT